MEITVECDIRIASRKVYFNVFEGRRGVIAEVAAQRLARTMPIDEAMHLMLTGNKMPAERAYRIGYVQQVVTPNLLVARPIEIAETIGSNAPISVQTSKGAVAILAPLRGRRIPSY